MSGCISKAKCRNCFQMEGESSCVKSMKSPLSKIRAGG